MSSAHPQASLRAKPAVTERRQSVPALTTSHDRSHDWHVPAKNRKTHWSLNRLFSNTTFRLRKPTSATAFDRREADLTGMAEERTVPRRVRLPSNVNSRRSVNMKEESGGRLQPVLPPHFGTWNIGTCGEWRGPGKQGSSQPNIERHESGASSHIHLS